MSTPEPDAQPPSRLARIWSLYRIRRQRRIRRRALKNLRIALGEAGDQLTADWVLRDRSLGKLRDTMKADPTWASLLTQLEEAQRRTPLRAKLPVRRKGTVTVPAHPWPWFAPIALWLLLTFGFAELLRRAVTNEAAAVFVVAAAIGAGLSLLFLAAVVDRRALGGRIARFLQPPRAQSRARRGQDKPPPDDHQPRPNRPAE